MKRVCVIGVFDLCHVGHIRFLERASKLGDRLYVALVDDEAVKKQKGDNRPIYSTEERFKIIKSLSFVYTVETVKDFDINTFVESVIRQSSYDKDDVVIFVKGEDQNHINYDKVKEIADSFYSNTMIVTLERTKDISTSDIINKIKGE
jgi:cytidyltransferase-like protein